MTTVRPPQAGAASGGRNRGGPMVTQHSLRRTVRVSLRRCLAGVAALALAGSMAASPAQAATSPAPASDNVLRIATDGFIDSFNPFTSFYLVPTNTFRYMYENLVANDAKDGSVTEGLEIGRASCRERV